MKEAALGLCKLSICNAYASKNKPIDYRYIFLFTSCRCSFAIGPCSCIVHMFSICAVYSVHAVA